MEARSFLEAGCTVVVVLQIAYRFQRHWIRPLFPRGSHWNGLEPLVVVKTAYTSGISARIDMSFIKITEARARLLAGAGCPASCFPLANGKRGQSDAWIMGFQRGKRLARRAPGARTKSTSIAQF